jgi:uncharacterized protein (DUF302 family)
MATRGYYQSQRGALVLAGSRNHLLTLAVVFLWSITLSNWNLKMSYTIDRLITDTDFEALAAHGFGVLTEIDVKATMKKKLDVEMTPYRILGACNPQMAHQAIGMEPKIGAMLPCNVILREVEGGVQVSAVDPIASMQAIDNDSLHAVAGQVRDMLSMVVEEI